MTVLDPFQVHDDVNMGDGEATGVRVYSPHLASMTYYDLADGVLAAQRGVSLSPDGTAERSSA